MISNCRPKNFQKMEGNHHKTCHCRICLEDEFSRPIFMYLGGQKDLYTEVLYFTVGLVNASESLYLCSMLRTEQPYVSFLDSQGPQQTASRARLLGGTEAESSSSELSLVQIISILREVRKKGNTLICPFQKPVWGQKSACGKKAISQQLIIMQHY